MYDSDNIIRNILYILKSALQEISIMLIQLSTLLHLPQMTKFILYSITCSDYIATA